jgi:putative two-component system response regulator
MQVLEAGADDYLGGPFTPDGLLSKVRLHLRLRAALSRLTTMDGPVRPYPSELERLVAERTRDIVAASGISVLTLGMLAESREVYAEDRLLRMRYYSSILAAQLARRGPYAGQIDVKFLKRLYRAVPLHDIGKIAISDAILLKGDPLTDVERKTMEEHTTIGAVILEQLVSHAQDDDLLDMAIVLARWHHERFDGTGYPSGLAGEDIPLPARIVAVADVYDALTTLRPYRVVETPEAARTIIEQQSGKQFDPALVAVFRQSSDDFVNVQLHFDCDFPTLIGAARFLD